MVRYKVIFHGHVQNSGFRYFTWTMAKIVGHLTGFIKNHDDGTVEMEIQGEDADIDALLDRIQKGQDPIRIDWIEKEPIAVLPKEKKYRVISEDYF